MTFPAKSRYDDDRLREECGVFGIYGNDDAAALTALGLHALQHRGQEAAGIVSFDGKRFHADRQLGLVGDYFTGKNLEALNGISAIGHVRYSTTGDTLLRNVQPLFADFSAGGFACAHNGNLTNAMKLRKSLIKQGAIFQSTSDTEVILQLMAQSHKGKTIDRLKDALFQVQGAYAFIALSHKKLIGARDPFGIRPLVLGKIGKSYILASESCAFDIIGAEFVREIDNGEIVVITEKGLESIKPFGKQKKRPCIFEYIYFSRPDSIIDGRNVYKCRKKFGQILAQESPIDADVIIPVPDSGVPAAIGYAAEAGIPFELGLIRNHYVGRTFIEPAQQIRQLGVRLKHSANRAYVENKRVVLVDDSIVRGTTAKKIVQMIKDAGAKEVHMRIACPPIRYPDYYGIDTPIKDQLIAATHDEKKIGKLINVDSLSFLSIEGLYRAMGYDARDNKTPQFTDHCFTGEYPTPLKDKDDDNVGSQLSFLNEKS